VEKSRGTVVVELLVQKRFMFRPTLSWKVVVPVVAVVRHAPPACTKLNVLLVPIVNTSPI
jgi:hypothetical protein